MANLAKIDDVLVSALAFHVLERDVVVIRDKGLDALDVDGLPSPRRDDVCQKARRLLFVDLALVDRGKRLDPCQCTLELSDVALHLVRDEVENLFWNQRAVVAQLRMKNGKTGFKVRRLDVGNQSPFKSRTEPVLECRDFLGWSVGRDDYLLVDLVQSIEGVEELLFRAVLARQELHVVDQEHVDCSVLVTELAHACGRYGADHLIGELLGCQVHDPFARKAVVNLVADGVHEVGLSKSHASVEKQRVVAIPRSLSHGLGGGMSELRVVPDDERREAEARIEL